MIQSTVFTVTVVLMLVVTGAFAYVAFNASKEAVDYPPLQEKSYSLRAKFFWVLGIVTVLTTVITTLDLPYSATRGDVASGANVVDVEGQQWFWKVGDTNFKARDTVIFNVTTNDVSHGLGIYGPDMRLLGQTQAMPGYTNSLEIMLEKPGKYKLLCMEYCGLAHHAMISEITVSE